MKKFEFRLNSVLRWRQTQLQAERAALSSLLGHEERLRIELATLRNQRHEAVVSLQQGNGFESLELRALSAFLVGVATRETALLEDIARRQHTIQQQRERVVLAERNVRLLEKLHDKRWHSWTLEYQKHIDANAEEAWLATHFGQAPR